MFVCEFHATFSCLDGSIASLRWQHSLSKDEVAMGTNSFFYIWLRQSVPALVVYPPFDAPHMLTCRKHSIFYFRKSFDDLEKVLSRRIVMFHAAECFVHDEANCAQVREAYSTVQ